MRFKQIAEAATAVAGWSGPGSQQRVEQKLYGLAEDGRVYMLTDQGWTGLLMTKAGNGHRR